MSEKEEPEEEVTEEDTEDEPTDSPRAQHNYGGKVSGVLSAVNAPSYGSDLTGPLIFGTIVVVGFGAAIGDHKVNGKALIAGGVVAVGLSAIDNVNERLAEGFAAIIFLVACFKFMPDIVRKLGYNDGGSGNPVDFSKAEPIKSTIQESSSKTPLVTKPAIYNTPFTPAVPTPTQATPQQSGGYQI
ncbi:hypothetical protein [Rhodococcus phage P19]|nr:hypothetical protein [Rhodococcus phage P19]